MFSGRLTLHYVVDTSWELYHKSNMLTLISTYYIVVGVDSSERTARIV